MTPGCCEASDRPLICIAAGAGIVPFRGLAQERKALLDADASARGGEHYHASKPILLFFGCRHPDWDDVCHQEFEEWEEPGVLQVFRFYSRIAAHRDECCARYVQDRMKGEWKHFKVRWDMGAKVYMCGWRAMADGVRDVIVEMMTADEGWAEAQARDQFGGKKVTKIALDLFD
ncbi:hypothetical protein LZ30DRAFT_784918 [Colletotrichum cereale]|nr:hypothetical protein LZ30DRAFT_784918 [Colletotrichum cereale]